MTRQLKRKATRDFAKAIEKYQKLGLTPPVKKKPVLRRVADFLKGRQP